MERKPIVPRDSLGNVVPNATVTLRIAATGEIATGLVDSTDAENEVPLSNPFTVDASGIRIIRAPDGEYDVQVVKDDLDWTTTYNFLDVSGQVGAAEAAQEGAELAEGAALNYRDQAAVLKESVDQALVNAQAIVVSGDVALVPTAGQVPLAQPNGYINPNWVPKALEPVQAIENPAGLTGLIIPDDTQYVFTPQMSQQILAFVPETLTQEMQLYRQGEYGVYLTTDKKLRVNWGGSYQTIDSLTVSNDWVDIAFSYNDNESSAVTFDVNVNYAPFGSQQVFSYSDEYIRNIFADDYGFLHVASMGYGHQTNAGLLKMNNWGDPCGSLPSVAGAAVTLAQVTGTARPLIGRVPVGGARNILTDTNSIYAGASVGATRTNNFAISSDGQNDIALVTANVGVSITTGGSSASYIRSNNTATPSSVATSYEFKAAGLDRVTLIIGSNDDFTSGTLSVTVSLVDGSIVNSFGSPSQAAVEAVGDGWFRVKLANSRPALNTRYGFRLANSVATTGDGILGILVRRPQQESGLTCTPYQRVGSTARDVTESGVLDQEYLYFDAADDVLSGTVEAITGGEIIIAGRNGIWHDSLTVAAGTFSIGPDTYTGGPAGILAAIGDFIGCAVLERPFTTPEANALIAFYTARGAGALL